MKKLFFALPLSLMLLSCGNAVNLQDRNDGYVDLGYTKEVNEKNTYAIDRVEVAKTTASYTTIWEYLRGRVPGVQIGSAATGQTPSITIRGEGSMNSGTQPLFIVDGATVPSIESINPNDIYSVDVLKDASTALYGSRGANGVLIIKTKSAVEAARAAAALKRAERQAKKASK